MIDKFKREEIINRHILKEVLINKINNYNEPILTREKIDKMKKFIKINRLYNYNYLEEEGDDFLVPFIFYKIIKFFSDITNGNLEWVSIMDGELVLTATNDLEQNEEYDRFHLKFTENNNLIISGVYFTKNFNENMEKLYNLLLEIKEKYEFSSIQFRKIKLCKELSIWAKEKGFSGFLKTFEIYNGKTQPFVDFIKYSEEEKINIKNEVNKFKENKNSKYGVLRNKVLELIKIKYDFDEFCDNYYL